MSSDIQGIFQSLIPQINQNQTSGNKHQSQQIKASNIIIANNPTTNQYTSRNEQSSFSANVNQIKNNNSPLHWRSGQASYGLNNNDNKLNSATSNITTYYSSLSPAPATYQFNSSAYQSPQQKITAFNVNSGGINSLEASNNAKNYTTSLNANSKKPVAKQVLTSSQVQQQLYKSSSNGTTLNNGHMYEYKRIINNQSRNGGSDSNSNGILNDGSKSPVNTLLNVDKKGGVADYQLFSTYAAGESRVGQQTSNINVNNFKVQNVSYSQYQPIKTTLITSPVQISNNQYHINGVKQQFHGHNNYHYKPQSAKITFNTQNNNISSNLISGGHNTANSYNYSSTLPNINSQYASGNNQTAFTTVQQQNFIPSYSSNQYQSSYQTQNVIQPQATYQSNYQYQQQNIQANARVQTKIQNKSQMYQIIDQIQRPKYQKLYGMEQNDQTRMMIQQDPPLKKGLCGPLCWLPLLILGAVLALFGMLCGLGIVCPGGASLTPTATTVGQIFVDPSVAPGTIKPQVKNPEIIIPIVTPQTIKPNTMQPQQIPSFNAGIPTFQTVIPSYVPPISIAPSANPVEPIVPSLQPVKWINGTVPAISEPVFQLQPQVIKYDRKIDQYTIDATPQIVGVSTYVNTQVMSGEGNNTKSISSVIDYSNKNMSILPQVNNTLNIIPLPTQYLNVTSTNITTLNQSTVSIPQVPQQNTFTAVNKSKVDSVDNGWIDPFVEVNSYTMNTSQTITNPDLLIKNNSTSLFNGNSMNNLNRQQQNRQYNGQVKIGVNNEEVNRQQKNAQQVDNSVGYITTVQQLIVNENNNNRSNFVKSNVSNENIVLSNISNENMITMSKDNDNKSVYNNNNLIVKQDEIGDNSYVIQADILASQQKTNYITSNITKNSNNISTSSNNISLSNNISNKINNISNNNSNSNITNNSTQQQNHIQPQIHIQPQMHIQPYMITTTTFTTTNDNTDNYNKVNTIINDNNNNTDKSNNITTTSQTTPIYTQYNTTPITSPTLSIQPNYNYTLSTIQNYSSSNNTSNNNTSNTSLPTIKSTITNNLSNTQSNINNDDLMFPDIQPLLSTNISTTTTFNPQNLTTTNNKTSNTINTNNTINTTYNNTKNSSNTINTSTLNNTLSTISQPQNIYPQPKSINNSQSLQLNAFITPTSNINNTTISTITDSSTSINPSTFTQPIYNSTTIKQTTPNQTVSNTTITLTPTKSQITTSKSETTTLPTLDIQPFFADIQPSTI